MWPPPGSCIKASPPMQPVAASPKGDLNTGVLLYLLLLNTLFEINNIAQFQFHLLRMYEKYHHISISLNSFFIFITISINIEIIKFT